MLRFSKAALVAGALTAFPTPILPVSFELESHPAERRRAQDRPSPPALFGESTPDRGGFDAQAILQTAREDSCRDDLCPLTLTEYALVESGRESLRISGLLSPINRRLFELFEGRLMEEPRIDLLFERF